MAAREDHRGTCYEQTGPEQAASTAGRAIVTRALSLANRKDASPVNRLAVTSRLVKLACPSDLGIEPDKRFSKTWRSRPALNEPKLSGMEPVSLFLERSSWMRRDLADDVVGVAHAEGGDPARVVGVVANDVVPIATVGFWVPRAEEADTVEVVPYL
ncbi:hypothetical protein Cgig2_031892 [Carnegiea gigantea]|uniref:Uncharacterized protein n=1 Tax=Carnegiea gigantea TaxID=171969 RepID=A0A9Q1QMI6_9CARY|nr:hypothetical protein Cgig2_031892 [Carnegiea gigantea]